MRAEQPDAGRSAKDHFPRIHVAGVASSLEEARLLLRRLRINLLFLDMELPDVKI